MFTDGARESGRKLRLSGLAGSVKIFPSRHRKMNFWNKFYEQPLDKIPWQNTQADWFSDLVDRGEVKGTSALDLVCGTGKKSIYLAKHGFGKVIGVDIADRAVEIAKQNALKEGVSGNCVFIAEDALEWAFSNKEEFDLILDWAYLHCLPPEKRNLYASTINNASKKGSLYLIRAFSSRNNEEYFEETVDDAANKIYFLDEKKISGLLPNFEIVKKNESAPRTKPDFYFTELLMIKN
ncbi:MAG TPA: class I SAM-dependent methyltransferase [Candidatus Paceibacterota bacterium]|nr:class I SAM-dependent methyltransferase [Candidatus Paceibacterota bacterium]